MRFDPEQNPEGAAVRWLARFPYLRINPPAVDREGNKTSTGAVEFSQPPGLKVWGILDFLRSQGWRVVPL